MITIQRTNTTKDWVTINNFMIALTEEYIASKSYDFQMPEVILLDPITGTDPETGEEVTWSRSAEFNPAGGYKCFKFSTGGFTDMLVVKAYKIEMIGNRKGTKKFVGEIILRNVTEKAALEMARYFMLMVESSSEIFMDNDIIE